MLFQPALGAFLGLTGGSPVNPLMGSSFLFSNTARSGWWVSASMTRALLPSERVYMKPGLSAGSGGGQVLWSPLSSGPVVFFTCPGPCGVFSDGVVWVAYKARVGRDPLPAPGGRKW